MSTQAQVYELGREGGRLYELLVEANGFQRVRVAAGGDTEWISPAEFYDVTVAGEKLAALIEIQLCPGLRRATLTTPAGEMVLRHFVPDDGEGLAALQFDPVVMRYLGGANEGSRADWVEKFRERYARWNLHYAAVCAAEDESEVLGRVGFLNTSVPREPEFFIVLLRRLMGKKVGRALTPELIRQAFAHPHPVALRAGADPSHEASVALLREAGFSLSEVQTAADELHGRTSYRLSRNDARRPQRPTA